MKRLYARKFFVTEGRRVIAPTLILLVLAAAPTVEGASVEAAVEAVVESARQYVPAKVIERSPPRYPGTELAKAKEGWVRVAYCIDESGSTRNVTVLDSIGGRRFDKSALQTVEEWKFEPALVDGEPSWQSRNQVMISFALKGDNKGASNKFVRQFKKLSRLVEKKELEEFDELFWRVHDTYDLSLYELSKLWAQRVRYEGMKGDMYKVDLALHRATASKGQWIDKKSHIRLLALRVRVEVKIGQYKAAIEAYEQLVELAGTDAEDVLALGPLIDNLNDLIDGDRILKIDAKVRNRDECHRCNDSWSFSPVRRTFLLENISGSLTSVEMKCDHKRYESEVAGQVQWAIPESWGDCHIDIYGDVGTTFDLLMLPASQS